jgi:hypothetical protein
VLQALGVGEMLNQAAAGKLRREVTWLLKLSEGMRPPRISFGDTITKELPVSSRPLLVGKGRFRGNDILELHKLQLKPLKAGLVP